MSGILNLESTIRTCKVDTAYSSRIQSDRFLNPANMVCPAWNGLDTAGRQACANSFYTKREGCNSAQDRVGVENNLRPNYIDYISFQTAANQYNQNYQVPEGVKEQYLAPKGTVREGFVDTFSLQSGMGSSQPKIFQAGFGQNLAASVYPATCAYNRYDNYSKSVGL